MPNLIVNPYGLNPYGDYMNVLCAVSYGIAAWDLVLPVLLTTMDGNDPAAIQAEIKASAKAVFEATSEITMQEGEVVYLIGAVV